MVLTRGDIVLAMIRALALPAGKPPSHNFPCISVSGNDANKISAHLLGAAKGDLLRIANLAHDPDLLDRLAALMGVGANSIDCSLTSAMWEVVPAEGEKYLNVSNDARTVEVPRDTKTGGYLLSPGKVYLAKTVHSFNTYNCVPVIDGRSSTARHGVTVNVSSSYGNVGFNGHLTLELTTVRPTIVPPASRLAKILFIETTSPVDSCISSRYSNTWNTSLLSAPLVLAV